MVVASQQARKYYGQIQKEKEKWWSAVLRIRIRGIRIISLDPDPDLDPYKKWLDPDPDLYQLIRIRSN